jgi:hypothetical protein
MALGFPGSGLVHAGAAAPVATGSLSVETDPAGASVVVDGQSWGVTPLVERTLAPGDHRVRVVKDGYLENSRVVSVQAGQAGRVQVRLTPDGNTSAVREQRDPTAPQQPKSGGGSKKALLIGLGVVAVGAGVYLATKEGNKAPTVGGVTASPTTGLQGATSISFSAQASDPNNDALTYDWNFGDGSTGSGATVTKTYTTSGTMAVSVTVKDPKGLSATGNASVTIRSLAGTWRGNITGGTVFNTVVTLTHTGSTIAGSYTDQFGSTTAGPVNGGSVASPNTVRFQVNPACCVPFTFAGTASGDLNTISGTVNGSGFVNAPWTLTR